jgi:hypothetical protein
MRLLNSQPPRTPYRSAERFDDIFIGLACGFRENQGSVPEPGITFSKKGEGRAQISGLLVDPLPSWAVTPGRWTRRVSNSMKEWT